jgi:hypothetical protein
VRAELHGAVFTGANLEGVELAAYSLRYGRVPVNITMECFGKHGLFKRPHINEDGPQYAEHTYRALKTYFLKEGDYDSASWASYCERLMQRKALWKDKNFFGWLTSLLFSAVSGYGEKPKRVFLSSLIIVVLYAFIYYIFQMITSLETNMPLTFLDALYFSAATFSGLSFSDLVPRTNAIIRLIVTTEAFGGIFALSLFVFTLTKRYVAR